MNTPGPTTTGQELIVTGIAEHSKMGAVVVAEDGKSYHISGKSDWDAEGYFRKKIKVTGILETRNFSPEELKNAKGEYSQGLSGSVSFIRMTRCELVK